MVHVTEGALRRYLEEPASVTDVDRAHLAGCRRCSAETEAMAGDRDAVAAALDAASGPVSGADVDRAWAALTDRLGSAEVVPLPVGRPTRPAHPRRLRHPVAAGVAAGLLVIGGTAAAAATDWLPIFRTETVAPVTVSMADVGQLSELAGLSGLQDYGDLTTGPPPQVTRVGDAAAAERRSGLRLPAVGALPAGVSGDPTYLVVDHQAAGFTFDAAKARDAAGSLPPVPAGLDGATLKLDAGPAVAQAWLRGAGSDGAGRGEPPTLVVARAKAPTVSSQGASLSEVRDYLLSIPGIPADLARQLRTMSTDGTLPIPVLAGEMSSSGTTVAGVPATVVTGSSGTGSAVLWVRDGQLDVVLGTLPTTELVQVANGLH